MRDIKVKLTAEEAGFLRYLLQGHKHPNTIGSAVDVLYRVDLAWDKANRKRNHKLLRDAVSRTNGEG